LIPNLITPVSEPPLGVFGGDGRALSADHFDEHLPRARLRKETVHSRREAAMLRVVRHPKYR
jgi:hypothetical protein